MHTAAKFSVASSLNLTKFKTERVNVDIKHQL